MNASKQGFRSLLTEETAIEKVKKNFIKTKMFKGFVIQNALLCLHLSTDRKFEWSEELISALVSQNNINKWNI